MNLLFGAAVFVSAVLAGSVLVWKLYSRYPKHRRWVAWGMMGFGLLMATFSIYAGVYFGVLGAAMHAFCDTGESSPE